MNKEAFGLRDVLARQVRKALGQFNDDSEAVVTIVKDVARRLEATDELLRSSRGIIRDLRQQASGEYDAPKEQITPAPADLNLAQYIYDKLTQRAIEVDVRDGIAYMTTPSGEKWSMTVPQREE